ncbi:MAG: hypothetical protein QM789_04855 [Paenirhodobacter sp.]
MDIRSADEFTGKMIAPEGSKETAVRAGHVTGAVNVPWSKAVQEDGRVKFPEELKALYAEAGHHLLPHRRAVQPYLVRPVEDPRL